MNCFDIYLSCSPPHFFVIKVELEDFFLSTHARFFITTTLFVMYLFLFFWLSNLQVKFVKSAQETNNFCYLKRQDSISERNPTQLQYYQILSKSISNHLIFDWLLSLKYSTKRKSFSSIFILTTRTERNWTNLSV